MRPEVELRFPCDTAYVAVLRMAVAGVAARADFTIEEIDDLRIAVGEACAIVLEGADPEGVLTAACTLGDTELHVVIAADTTSRNAPDHDSFAWQVLSALTTDLESTADEHQHAISLTVRSGVTA